MFTSIAKLRDRVQTVKQGRSLSKEFKISSSEFWTEESCNKNCNLFSVYFATRTDTQPSLLCCNWLFKPFLLCDWLFRTVRLQTQTVRLQTQNSAITLLQLNSYFSEPIRMQESPVISKWNDIIKPVYYWGYKVEQFVMLRSYRRDYIKGF